jgi:hypothetical protein
MIYHASLLLNHGWRGYEGEGPNSQQAGIELLAPVTLRFLLHALLMPCGRRFSLRPFKFHVSR